MKRFLLIALLIYTASCSNKDKIASPVVTNSTYKLAVLPEWVIDPKMDEKITAVGIASPSIGGFDIQLRKAELDAKANLASQIGSEVSRVTKAALRQAKIDDLEDVEQVFSQATKDVVKRFPLSGAKRINIYQGNDGTLYVRMTLDENEVIKYFSNNEGLYKRQLKQANLSRENLDKAQEAVKELFVDLD